MQNKYANISQLFSLIFWVKHLPYLTDKQQEEIVKKVKQQMVKKGFMTKDGRVHVKLDTDISEIKKGDLVITYEIYVVREPWESSKTEFKVTEIIPTCCVDHSLHSKETWTNCRHDCIKYVGAGQQGIAKLVKTTS